MADEQANENQEEDKVEGSSGKNPMLTLLVILNTLVTAVAAYMVWDLHVKESQRLSAQDIAKAYMEELSEQEKALNKGTREESEDGQIFPLDPFTANLAQGDGPRRYIRLTAVLKFSGDSKEAEYKARKPQIRDTFINILNSKRPDDLMHEQGKVYLKEELKSAINTFLIDSKLINIYYMGFQIN